MDSEWIAYSKFGEARIWVIDEDGTNPTQTIDDGFEPTWSPDGSKIAFSRRIIDAEHDVGLWIVALVVMNADGSNQVEIARGVYHLGPSWSPDGTRIVYHRIGSLCPCAWLWIIDADGSNAAELTYGATPSWSPVETRIPTVIESDSWGTIKADVH
jgi:TolB protein